MVTQQEMSGFEEIVKKLNSIMSLYPVIKAMDDADKEHPGTFTQIKSGSQEILKISRQALNWDNLDDFKMKLSTLVETYEYIAKTTDRLLICSEEVKNQVPHKDKE